MRIRKEAVIVLTVIVLIVIVLVSVSRFQKNRDGRELAERIYAGSSEASPDSINDLRKAIALYQKRVEQHVQDAAKNALYWKLLAVRLQDRGLHGEALEALEQAIYYSPADPFLHYYTGVSAGVMAKSVHIFPGRDDSERKRYFALAEDAYLRSIELDPRYLRPRYGIGVLYVFELERPGDAVPHLQRCLEISRNDVDTMFVLARAFFMLRDYQKAVDLYDRIITLTGDEQKRTDARNNRQQIMGLIHG